MNPQAPGAQPYQGPPRVPLRPAAPPNFAPPLQQRPQQPFGPPQPGAYPPRPQQLTGAPQRPPQGLQFGPRQPPQLGGGLTTPDDAKLFVTPPPTVGPRPGGNQAPVPGPLPRQSSQSSIKGTDFPVNNQNKPVNLDNQSIFNENNTKLQGGDDLLGAAKGRSYSIAAPPGAPSPLKTEDDRRKSISSLGGKIDDFSNKPPGLGLIQESQEHIRSNDTIKTANSDTSLRMTDSFMGSLPKKRDDDDDVVLQNNLASTKTVIDSVKQELPSRMSSVIKNEDPLELKPKPQPQVQQNISPVNKAPFQTMTPEQRPKPDIKPVATDSDTSDKEPMKPPLQEPKPPIPIQKKPTELNTNVQPRPSARQVASAPKQRNKGTNQEMKQASRFCLRAYL